MKNILFIGETENYTSDIQGLCGIIGVKNSSLLLNRRNISAKPQSDKPSPELRNSLQSHLKQEYLIYNKLKGIKL